MNVLIKSATIIDTKSDANTKTQDVLIEKGIITKIGTSLENPKKYREINLDNLHISQGWFDSSVSFGEPGYEERETISNGLNVAAKSGFTSILINPNSNPVITTNTDVVFLKSKAINHAVSLHPIGALTLASKGQTLAELFDMKNAGAVAFYDYKQPIKNANLMKIALQYASTFNGLICSYPMDSSICSKGIINEGVVSTVTGLKGIPNLAEDLQIERDLSLLEYTEGKLHIPTISTKKAVDFIRIAKQKQLDITCSVCIHNLILTDEHLTDFDTNFKVLPPLRTQEDINALHKGLEDGTIDMITSDHNPLNIELKKIEFDYAQSGTIGLETAFGILNKLFSTTQTIKYLTSGKERFGLKQSPIKEGHPANITLFNPEMTYTFSEAEILSKSKNAIFLNKQLKGKVYGVINNNNIIL